MPLGLNVLLILPLSLLFHFSPVKLLFLLDLRRYLIAYLVLPWFYKMLRDYRPIPHGISKFSFFNFPCGPRSLFSVLLLFLTFAEFHIYRGFFPRNIIRKGRDIRFLSTISSVLDICIRICGDWHGGGGMGVAFTNDFQGKYTGKIIGK